MNNVYPSPHPLVGTKITLLRNVKTEPKKFRELIREISALLAYEATLDLAVSEIGVQTPLMMSKGTSLAERIGLVPVLRAGLGMVEGIWELMPGAEVWHIGLYCFGPHVGDRWISCGNCRHPETMGRQENQISRDFGRS